MTHPMAEPWYRWNPIETAPKDGTWLLIYESIGVNTKWSACDIAHWSDDQWANGGDYPVRPTHWMPLPESPKP